jgi:hypothetical protein
MIVTLKLKTQLSFLKIHALLLLMELLLIIKSCLNMLYDNALDDGSILIDNSSCIHEDKNNELSGCDDALIHESPMLFLKSPIYTIEEKYAYVEKYIWFATFL